MTLAFGLARRVIAIVGIAFLFDVLIASLARCVSLRGAPAEQLKAFGRSGGANWIKTASLLTCALIGIFVGDGFSSRLFAQQKNDRFPPFIDLELALQAPVFDATDDVVRHGVFSIILANLIADASNHASADLCTISVASDFPDLNIKLWVKEKGLSDQDERTRKNALGICIRSIENVATKAVFERGAFDSAIQQAQHDYRPRALGSGDLNPRQWSVYRLPIIGRAALADLYRPDVTVSALLNVYNEVESKKDAYPDFVVWLDRQRQSRRMGFYDLNERTVGDMHRLVTLESTPSSRPVLTRAQPFTDELHVEVPDNVRGRSSILVRCTKERDRTCGSDLGQVVCNKEIARLVSSSKLDDDHSQSTTRCAVIDLLGIGTWIVVECDSESWLRRLWGYLAMARMQRAPAFDWSLVEYAVWIETTQ